MGVAKCQVAPIPEVLIFASGLLMCFNCYLKPPAGIHQLFEMPQHLEPLLLHLRAHARMTPLEILADTLSSFAKPETAVQIFDAYDRFLAIMNDGAARRELSALKARDVQHDRWFDEIRKVSNAFQEGLNHLFFDDNLKIAEL